MGRKAEAAGAEVGMGGQTFTIGVQVGGSAADRATDEHVMALREVVRRFLKGPYSSEVIEFALLLRIQGDVGEWDWFVEGCSRLRRNRKDRYLSIDIGISSERWRDVPGRQLREYVAHCIREALQLFIDRLKRDKTPIDDSALLRDYSAAMKNYL